MKIGRLNISWQKKQKTNPFDIDLEKIGRECKLNNKLMQDLYNEIQISDNQIIQQINEIKNLKRKNNYYESVIFELKIKERVKESGVPASNCVIDTFDGLWDKNMFDGYGEYCKTNKTNSPLPYRVEQTTGEYYPDPRDWIMNWVTLPIVLGILMSIAIILIAYLFYKFFE